MPLPRPGVIIKQHKPTFIAQYNRTFDQVWCKASFQSLPPFAPFAQTFYQRIALLRDVTMYICKIDMQRKTLKRASSSYLRERTLGSK